EAKDRQEIISKSLESVQFIKEAIGAKDWTTVNFYGNLSKWSTDATVNTLNKYLDPADRARAMTEGKDFWATRVGSESKDDVIRTLALLNQQPLHQALTTVANDATFTAERSNTLASNMLNDAQAYITSPSVPK